MTQSKSGRRIRDAQFVASAPEARLLPPPVGVEIAFAGRSNVGKSTLLNALLERHGLARTSSTPGCTREVVLFHAVASDGAEFTIADLPGYGYAKRSKTERAQWADLVEDYLLGRPSLNAVVVLVDVRRGLEADDRDLLKLIASPARTSRRKVETLVVATKLDKLPKSAQKPALEKVAKDAGLRVLGFAASDPRTHEALYRAVRKIAGLPLDVQGIAPAASAPDSSRSQSP